MDNKINNNTLEDANLQKMPDARCPMPDARCPMPDARCPMFVGYWLRKIFPAKKSGLDLLSYIIIFYKITNYIIQQKYRLLFFIILTFSSYTSKAQNCTSTDINGKTISICGNNCTAVKLTTQNLRNTSNYSVRTIPYKPYPYVTNFGFEDLRVYDLRAFSNVQNIPFSFCFYDSVYNKFVYSTNGVITFDTTNAAFNCLSAFQNGNPLPNIVGVQCSGNNYSPKASIYTVHCDLDPRIGPTRPSPPDRKIEFRTEGQAPCRRFIVSYYKIGTFGTFADANCSADNTKSIFQTVLYESTGIIEMYIEKFVCPAIYSSLGRATLGIQNWARDKALCAPGKNAQAWTAIQEAYQFLPNGSATRFINSKIYSLNGNFIANADTSSNADGTLNLSFNNVCPSASTITPFLVKTSFKACPNNDTLVYTDTIQLVKNNGIAATLTAPLPCTGDTSRTLTVNAIGDNFTYSLNGGLPQTSNTFTNVPIGLNQILVTGTTSSCTALFTAFIGTSSINLQSRSDTAICAGDAIVLHTTSNATQYLWQPSSGLSNATIASPTANPNVTTQYIVTAQQGNCIKKDTVNIAVLPKPMVDAGSDITIINGDDAILNGNATNANSYAWSPTIFLNNSNSLFATVVKPTSTTLYTLTAFANGGCTATDDVLVTVLPICVAIKEGFTPNGDGINDLWQIYSSFSCLKNVAVKVYNRYGSVVYENNNYRNNWDGTYKGKPIPDAAYYYQIEFTFVSNKKYLSKGNVTIIR